MTMLAQRSVRNISAVMTTLEAQQLIVVRSLLWKSDMYFNTHFYYILSSLNIKEEKKHVMKKPCVLLGIVVSCYYA